MYGTPEIWTVSGLLDYFIETHSKMKDRAFAFILGAGASHSSGIPIGGELVNRWLLELQKRLMPETEQQSIRDWANAENLNIDGFEYSRAAEFYPQVYSRRFYGDPEEGYAHLEAVMEGKDPSFGYSVLAQIMASTQHRVAITTNFDNLIADAIAIYAKVHPFVCGHESLTRFVRVRMRRPLVAKIHRDLLMAPFSQPGEIAQIAPEWGEALRALFKDFIPIFIGYGGNDGSLMGFLEALNPGEIIGRSLWCYREQDGLPNCRIRNLVAQHHGALIPILGFDEFMLLLGEKLGFGLLGDNIERLAKERADLYQSQVGEIKERLGRLAQNEESRDAAKAVKEALVSTLNREAGPRQWLYKALLQSGTEDRKQLYEEGLLEYPYNLGLLISYAQFAASELKDLRKAEELYDQALEKYPEDEKTLMSAAQFSTFRMPNYDKAKSLLEKAIVLNPENSVAFSNLGLVLMFMESESEAELSYRRALELNPTNAKAMSNLAALLHRRNKYDEAESFFRKSVELDPQNRALITNLALFLFERGQVEESRQLAAMAWNLPDRELDRFSARLMFLHASIIQLEGRDNLEPLGRLKYLLSIGFPRGGTTWYFDNIMKLLNSKLSQDDLEFYKALAKAISEPSKVEDLEAFESWKRVVPIDASRALWSEN